MIRWLLVGLSGLLLGQALLATLAAASEPASPATTVAALAKKDARRPPSCDRTRFHALIDVGHSAEAVGARSARGAPEFEFNLRLAKEIVQQLVDAGFAKTELLVSEGPAQASLSKRVAHVNRVTPDILLSIHHDSVPDKFLEKWEFEGVEHSFSDRFKGHSIFVSWDNPFRRASLRFARLLGRQLKDRGLQYTPHYTEPFMGRRRRRLVDADVGVYRYDQLRVLRETTVPSVLLEAGSIINRDEELLLDSPEHRALISAAVVDAVASYCARPPRKRPH